MTELDLSCPIIDPPSYESEDHSNHSNDECFPLSPDCVTGNEQKRNSESSNASQCSTISKDTSSNGLICRICHSSSGINKGKIMG